MEVCACDRIAFFCCISSFWRIFPIFVLFYYCSRSWTNFSLFYYSLWFVFVCVFCILITAIICLFVCFRWIFECCWNLLLYFFLIDIGMCLIVDFNFDGWMLIDWWFYINKPEVNRHGELWMKEFKKKRIGEKMKSSIKQSTSMKQKGK